MAKHNDFGREGEQLAADFLQAEGYYIRHRNWRCGRKELDIVAEKDGYIVVVEVKSRKNDEFGKPEDALTPLKIRHIVAATDAYLCKFALDLPVRFDLVTVLGTPATGFQVEHIVHAFNPPLW